MSARNLKHHLLAGLTAFALGWAGAAQAAGSVEAIAGPDTDINSGPGAFASFGSSTATTTRSTTQAAGSIANAFTDLRTPVRSFARSDFTIVGLNGTVPLTFNWQFVGGRSWNANNASFGATLSVGVSAPGFIDTFGWGISYVDGPPALGDFAGILSSTFTVSAAGSGFVNALPAGGWDGRGTRSGAITLTSAGSGLNGSFSLLTEFGFAGQVTANYSTRLVSVTVANASQIAPGAHLLLDDGSRVAITAVPEPETWAMLIAGLALVSLRGRRRA